MSHYKANVRDLEFNLFEVFGPGRWPSGTYPEFDEETVRGILAEVERLAANELAASFAESDRHPPVFDPVTHTAPIPEPFRRSYRAWMDSGFWQLGLPEELGGQPCPAPLVWAVAEMVLGANPAIWMYGSGPAFAGVIWDEGTIEQKQWARLFVKKLWGSTMVLTEPDAGSDVGAARTRAVQQLDGSWHIEGVKRFITSGEHDLAENIIHLVLARPEGAGPGTKGLSLFIVPKIHFDPTTGELGARNGVFATNLEDKMGLKVSNTCELTFGAGDVPAVGWLLGDVHDGIRQMFKVIEMARMMVGTKAMATLSTAYLNALEFAKTRVQFADLTQMRDKTAPRVAIIRHPDVRRSLLVQKTCSEGLRALVCWAAKLQDQGKTEMNDMLLPIVKALCSERAYELAGSLSLQIFGGSGYLKDYPLEQYVRDAKIDSIYEGTTAIQALDLFFRKLGKSNDSVMVLMSWLKTFLADEVGGQELKDIRSGLGQALAALEDTATTFGNWIVTANDDPQQFYKVGLSSRGLLLAIGDLLVGGLLARQAAVAVEALARGGLSEADVAFYTGKVIGANFYGLNILPRAASDFAVAKDASLDVMTMDDTCL